MDGPHAADFAEDPGVQIDPLKFWAEASGGSDPRFSFRLAAAGPDVRTGQPTLLGPGRVTFTLSPHGPTSRVLGLNLVDSTGRVIFRRPLDQRGISEVIVDLPQLLVASIQLVGNGDWTVHVDRGRGAGPQVAAFGGGGSDPGRADPRPPPAASGQASFADLFGRFADAFSKGPKVNAKRPPNAGPTPSGRKPEPKKAPPPPPPGAEHYRTLGLSPSATDQQIKLAFRRLMQVHHSDRGGDDARGAAITQAYAALKKLRGFH